MTIDDIKKKKIGFISLGCDKNRVDLEKMIFNLKSFGFEIENNPSLANIIVVNSFCGGCRQRQDGRGS